ncbi:MAG: histidine kinase [Flavobacteriaceae bacterium]|nr:histidine kinase [Flavobacteriaceae bacterium]
MKKQNNKEILNSLWLTIKIALIVGIVFIPINNEYNLKSILTLFLISFIYSFVLGFGQIVISKLLTKKFDWIKQTKKRVWYGIICTILYTFPAVIICTYIAQEKILNTSNPPASFWEYINIFNGSLWSSISIFTYLFYTVIALLISAILHAKSFMQEWKKSVEQEKQQQQIIAKTESAKFESLKTQVDPHFLFNSLNVLTSLISENPEKAEKFTTKLSKVYRYVLEQRNKELVPISEELDFAKTYIDLLQMRFENAIRFEISAELYETELKIVPLSLQLLLENAVKHNVVSVSEPLTIKIYKKDKFLVIENNKNVKQILEQKSTKVGLQNIADRYGLISEKRVKINSNNDVFSVEIPLLKKVEFMETVKNTAIEEKAKGRVAELKAFYVHLITYIVGCVFFVTINYMYTPKSHWFIFPVLGWGIGILSHTLQTFEIPLFGKKWEERKIKEYIEKNS